MADKVKISKKAKTKAELLVEYGFIKEDKKENYVQNKENKTFSPVEGDELDKKDADEEEKEMVAHGEFFKTGYPRPLKSYRVTLEQYDLSLEEPYYWFLEYLKQNFERVEKVEDSFAAAENSAFFGVTQQRLGAQQDRVSQFLATIGKMIKELFQMVRELRIIKERLGYYRGVAEEIKKPLSDRDKRDEITLKGVFIDLVQGGGKSAASVYGMATQLEFITLPDLFFDLPPFKDGKEMEKWVDSMEKDFNRNVLRVLKRHLAQYQSWKESTHKEHENREKFMLSYLRQHFEIVQMYVQWIKPYLHHVSKLGMKTSSLESADIVSAFEGSLLDIEIIAKKHKDGANGCVLLTFNYRTRPELKVVQEGYQRGPVHIGRLEVNSRVYAWTDEQVELYKKMKVEETFWLLGDVSKSIQTAMESLGSELFRYHREATGEGEAAEEKKEEEGDGRFLCFWWKREESPFCKRGKRERGEAAESYERCDRRGKVSCI
ncbi:hypothetical protein HYX13_01730 [Candidatus Woesearchaeota archaeon]|nr:hypothetical protein [Candidatus Woesearchaeota archaeon]